MYDNIVYIGGELEKGTSPTVPAHCFEVDASVMLDKLDSLDPIFKTVIYNQREKLMDLYKSKTQDMVYLVLYYGSLPIPPDVNPISWETGYSDISWTQLHDIANTIPISIVSPVWNAQEQYIDICRSTNTKPAIKNFYPYHNNLQFVQDFMYKNIDYKIDYDCKKLFICMNANTKLQRTLLMGKLSQAGLLKHAHWSWLDANNKGKEMPRIHDFDPTNVIKLSNDILLHGARGDGVDRVRPHGHFVGSIYNDAYIDVSVETCGQLEALNYTEKTWRAYWFGKPCMQLAPPGHYKLLWDWGFQPYNELFNYENMDHPNISTRIKAIVDNLSALAEKTQDEMNTLIKNIVPKIIHNHNTVKNLSLDHMPTEQLKYLYEHHIIPNDLFFGHTEYQKYIGEKC